MRSTRETELAAEYPLHVVTAWIGNSVNVAMQSYLQLTEDYYKRAANRGAQGLQNPVQQASAADRTEPHEQQKTPEKPRFRAD